MMTHDHVDTPDRVEHMATWHDSEAAHLRAHHANQGSMPELAEMHEETAAMLRRLHTRAVDAERELADLIHDNTTLMDSLNAAEAALATIREDALREAANLCMPDGPAGLVPHPVAARAAILALIPQPTTTEET